MRYDATLHEEVLSALATGASYNAAEVGVTVHNGRVTLSGRVHSNAERIALTRAAKRVEGVREVADELMVTLGHGVVPTDREIGAAVRRVIESSLWGSVPEGVHSHVEGGRVILEGHLADHQAQEDLIHRLRLLPGVRSVISHLADRPVSVASGRPVVPSLASGLPGGWRAELRDRAEHHEAGIPIGHHDTHHR